MSITLTSRALLLASLSLPACASAAQTADTGATDARDAIEATANDAVITDAASDETLAPDAIDATDATATDAPADTLADSADNATLCDPAHETTSPLGVCDGRGMIACQMWAQVNGGAMAAAVCVAPPGGGPGCARATSCTSLTDPSTCRCGTGPACLSGEVCVTSVDTTPGCRCATGQ